MEIWVGKLVTTIQTGRGCCIVCTQHNFCTQQLRYVGITILVILFWISCVLKVWTNSFQEVLEAVLFGALTEFRQPLQVQSHLEMPGILVQLGHTQRT